jgi:hypothetical protein
MLVIWWCSVTSEAIYWMKCGMIMHDESWEEVVLAHFNVLSQQMICKNWGNCQKKNFGRTVSVKIWNGLSDTDVLSTIHWDLVCAVLKSFISKSSAINSPQNSGQVFPLLFLIIELASTLNFCVSTMGNRRLHAAVLSQSPSKTSECDD